DALWYVRQLGATHLVDVATLTGACVVALGKIASGLFGTPSGWVEQVRRVADRAGDRVWPMPLHEDYREQLKSDIADLTNTGGRPGRLPQRCSSRNLRAASPGRTWTLRARHGRTKPSRTCRRGQAESAFARLPSSP